MAKKNFKIHRLGGFEGRLWAVTKVFGILGIVSLVFSLLGLFASPKSREDKEIFLSLLFGGLGLIAANILFGGISEILQRLKRMSGVLHSDKVPVTNESKVARWYAGEWHCSECDAKIWGDDALCCNCGKVFDES